MLTILLWLKKLKLMIESELLSIIIFLVKVILKIGQERYLLSILFWKILLGHIDLDLDNYRFRQRKNNRKFLWKRIVAE